MKGGSATGARQPTVAAPQAGQVGDPSQAQVVPGGAVSPRLDRLDDATAIALALLLFAVYLLSYRGGFHSIDEVSMFGVTESMVKRGEFDTNSIIWTQWTTTQREAQGFFGQDGSVYSKKGLALSLLAAPLHWLALHAPGIGMLQTVSLVNALVTAVTGSLLYLFARRLGYSPGPCALLGLIFGLATTSWVYARYLFSEPVSGLLLMLAALLALGFKQEGRWPFLVGAGLASGLAVTARANNVIVLPVVVLYLLVALAQRTGNRLASRRFWTSGRVWGSLAAFGTALLIAGGLMALYNWVRSGNASQTGYDLTIFSPTIWIGLFKLLFSPLRGFFWFSPILLLSPIAFVGFYRRHRPEAALAGSILLLNVVLFSAWTSGEGLSWGSRFLVPVLAFCVLPLIVPLDKIRGGRGGAWLPAFLILGGLSVLIQALAVAVNPWLHLIELRRVFPTEFLEDTPVLYDPQYSPIWGQVQQLLSWAPAKSDLAWLQPWSVQAGIAAGLLAFVAVSAAVLWWMVRQGRARHADSARGIRPAMVLCLLACVVLAVGLSFVALERYFDTDRQFGQPDNGLNRILDRVARDGAAGDGIVTIAPYHYHVAMNRYKGDLPIYGFAETYPLPAQAVDILRRLTSQHGRLWLITAGVRPGSPQNGVERWLSERAFRTSDEWYDDFRLGLFAASQPTDSPASARKATLGNSIQLDSYRLGPTRLRPGDLLTLVADWRAVAKVPADYSVFIHLVSKDGQLVAQRDSPPMGGFRPTTTWVPGDVVQDRHALLLPDGIGSGTYEVWLGLYDQVSGKRTSVVTSDGTSTDHVVLAEVMVE